MKYIKITVLIALAVIIASDGFSVSPVKRANSIARKNDAQPKARN